MEEGDLRVDFEARDVTYNFGELDELVLTRAPRSPPAPVIRYPPPTRVSNSWISPVISANSASFRRVVRPCLSDAQPADAMVRLFSRLISTPACRSRRSRPRR
jgi:hypothetical protein